MRPKTWILLALCASAACSAQAPEQANTTVYIPVVKDAALSWHAPGYANALFGARPLYDGPPTGSRVLAITRTVLHTNPRLSPVDALRLSGAVARAARQNGLPPEFLAATLLQESAFDPQVVSSAGAVGIAQFMPSTASEAGIDPYDPFDAIGGAAALLAQYVRGYEQKYSNPYAAALAAYNAGPGAVDAYRGIPPYPETREYIDDIVDRWAKIAGYERRSTGS